MSGALDYGSIMNNAMKGFVRDVLAQVARDGLPGEHHFFITLDTTRTDLEMADWLKEKYPEAIIGKQRKNSISSLKQNLEKDVKVGKI